MKKAVGFIFAALGILIYATLVLVVIPAIQLGRVEPEKGLKNYQAQESFGREIYISEGCMYCHSQQPRDPSVAPDDKRGWGRPSTPGDYAYDYPHQLGTMRTGPDLFNVGVRLSSEDWHFVHLYQPRALVKGSIMPSYLYLFEVKEKAEQYDRVVNIPAPYGPKKGVVVAKNEAKALVAYLLSLKHNYPSEQLPFRKPKTNDAKAMEPTP